MKKFNLFRHRPNEFQTQGILSRVSRECRKSVGRLSTLLFLIFLGLGFSGQAWAYENFQGVYMKYSYNGSNHNYEYGKDDSNKPVLALGELTSNFVINEIYMKFTDNWGTGRGDNPGGQMCYKINDGSAQYFGNNTWTKTWGSPYELQNSSCNLTIGDINGNSGKYTFEHWWQMWWNTTNKYCNNSDANYKFTYTILPPAVTDFAADKASSAPDVLSGEGTSASPYIIKYNGSLPLTASCDKAHDDANSHRNYKFGTNDYSTTNTYTISNITSSTKQSITVNARCINTSASLNGAESETKTIYYKAESAYSVTVNAGTGCASAGTSGTFGSVSGGSITATAATGYNTFNTWTITSGSGSFDAQTTASTTFYPTGISTITASFNPKTYAITFDDQEATTAHTFSISSATYNAPMTTFTSSQAPKKTGYDFNGYYTGEGGTGTKYYNADGTSANNWTIDASSTTTLYAYWTIKTTTITVYPENGNSTYTIIATFGQVAPEPWALDSKADYTFNCYNTTATGGSTVARVDENGKIYFPANTNYADGDKKWKYEQSTLNIYAQYIENQTINLDQQGATTPGTTVFYAANAPKNPLAKINNITPKITLPQRTGYKFLGYYTQENGQGTHVITNAGTWIKGTSGYTNENGYWTPTQTTDLYAHWQATNRTITFGVKSDCSAMGTLTAKRNDTSADITSGTSLPLGTSVTLTATPETGYELDGWYSNAECTQAITPTPENPYTFNLDLSTTVYVKFKYTDYTVSTSVLPVDKGTIDVHGQNLSQVHYQVPFQITATPNDGYSFSSWSCTPSDAFSFNDAPASNANTPARTVGLQTASSEAVSTYATLNKANNDAKTITANFAANNYTITLDKNEGAADGTASVTFDNNAVTSITHVGRTDYTRQGYFTAASGGTKVLNADGTFAATTVEGYITNSKWTKAANCTLYAQWEETTFAVTIEKGTGVESTTASPIQVGNVTPVEVTATAASGYTLAAWTIPAGITKVSGDISPISIKATAEGTITANATENQYQITFNANGGTGSKDAQTGLGCATAQTIAAYNNEFTKTGYHFDGWATSASGAVVYADKATVPALTKTENNSTLELFAHWAPNTNTAYTVKHYKQNLAQTGYDLADTDNLTGTTGATITPDVKSYDGFTAPSTTSATIAADGSTVVTYNYTRKSFTLTWELNGGTAGTGTITGSPALFETVLQYTVNPTKTGYNFNGWNPTMTSGSTTMPAANTTYTAQWTAKTYTITLDNQSATTAGAASVTATYNATVPSIAGNLPAKTGYAFDGYYTETNGGGTKIINADGTSTYVWDFDENKRLYANWIAVNVYLEGLTRFKDANGNIRVLNNGKTTSNWDLTIRMENDSNKFAFNSGVYYFNTRCTATELAANVGSSNSHIRLAIGNAGATPTIYGRNGSDYLFTASNTGDVVGITASSTNAHSFNFRDDQGDDFKRRGPVMYRYTPSNSKFEYCAPLLTLFYHSSTANAATMQGLTISNTNLTTTNDGLSGEDVTYYYKFNSGEWIEWNYDNQNITAQVGTYTIKAVASGKNTWNQNVEGVISNEITITVTQPSITSVNVTRVNDDENVKIIRVNDSFTLKHTIAGVPAGQTVQVCYHWISKPAGSQITKDIFTAHATDANSVNTTIDVAGDYQLQVTVSSDVCQNAPVVWDNETIPLHVKGDEITVYAKLEKNITDWNNKCVYYWKEGVAVPHIWPGLPMTYIGKDSVDFEWYSCDITNYKTYAGGNLLFNDGTDTYGLKQTTNQDMPEDDAFYYIKSAISEAKRTLDELNAVNITRRVILQTDTTALYQNVTITLESKGVFFTSTDKMTYSYTVTAPNSESVTVTKDRFLPTQMGNYTVNVTCTAGSQSVANTFILRVHANPFTLTPSAVSPAAINSTTTVTVAGSSTSGMKMTYTVIEPGTNSPVTFDDKSSSATSKSYTLRSSGTYTFGVVLTNTETGVITGKAECTLEVNPQTYWIKHPFVNTQSAPQSGDWKWNQLTYNATDGVYKYYGDDAYFHTGCVANINTTNSDPDPKDEYTIVNPDNLANNTKCIFTYDVTTNTVTVYQSDKRLYRIKSVCGEDIYYSNAFGKGIQISYYAQVGGQLIWQEYKNDEWTDDGTVTMDDPISTNAIYTSKPTISSKSMEAELYTGELKVFSQLTPNVVSTGSPSAEGGVMTKFNKSAASDYFDHYWVRYINTAGKQAMATFGNDINPCISTTLPYYEMPAAGNIRYAYDSNTNHFYRTFMKGSGAGTDFLTIYGDSIYTDNTKATKITKAAPKEFDDGSDWVYTAQIVGAVDDTHSATAVVKSKYNDNYQWILAESGLEADPTAERTLLNCDIASPGTYNLTVIYDFKTNRLTAGGKPENGHVFNDVVQIDQLLLTRENDGSATYFNITEQGKLVVVDRMTVEFDVTKEMWEKWPIASSTYRDMYYWLSLPYECRISDIYGLGTYGTLYEIQRYRGDLRAAGTAGSSTGKTAWRRLKNTATMEANRGYVVAIRVTENSFKNVTVDGVTKSIIRLFFPSKGQVELAHETKTSLQTNENNATSNLHWNWNIMGNPLITNGQELITSTTSEDFNFIYEWSLNGLERVYVPSMKDEVNILSTHSYMVQAKGDVNWAYPTVKASPARYLEPAHYASEGSYGNVNIRLNIKQNNEVLDKAYVLYREHGTRDYDMGCDLEKIINDGYTQMYASLDNNLAAICLNSEDTTMIPLTVIASNDGDYSISLHRQFNSNLEPTIYDAATGTYTNLSIGEFTTNLQAGTYENRFFFFLKNPGSITNLGEINSNNYGDGVHKIIMNNQLYIVRDGKLYNATGVNVK